MKKKFLLLSALVLGAASQMFSQEVVFDFSDPTTSLSGLKFVPMNLTELQGAKYDKNGTEKDRCYQSGNNHVLIIEGETISKDAVSFALSNPNKYRDFPRFFFGLKQTPYPDKPTAEHFYCDLRWYENQIIEISAAEGKKITKIVMNAKSGDNPVRQNSNTIVQTEGGTQTFSDDNTLNEWVADESTNVSKVTYKAKSGSTQMAYVLTVTLADAGNSAVASIEADENAPEEYFDLTGTRRNADSLAPGIYIVRKGSTAKKVVIK